MVRIAVEDEGPGIPMELRERIWDQVLSSERCRDRRMARVSDLWIVRDIVVKAGGARARG